MRVLLLLTGVALSAGCSVEQRGQSNGRANIDAAAQDAQGDIDTYAANRLAPGPTRPTPVKSLTPAPSPAATVADDAQAAAAVVRHYFDLIAARDYAAAWRLWDDGGEASGMTDRQFADSFARYASYRAKVGAPGRIDAGAGQRYVEVPVQVSGELADRSGPFAMAGSLTLHRAGDIDGATAEQRRWRIRDSGLRPRPAEATAAPAKAEASHRCAGSTRISVRFDNDAGTPTVSDSDGEVAVLEQQRAASGIWYKGDGHELRGKGRDADYSAPGRPPVACAAE